MRFASDFSMKGAGSVLSMRATAPSASAFRSRAPSGTISSSTTSWPALAMWAAMPPPIRPAPMTAAFWIAIDGHQAASSTVEMPWPPPMHWVASA